ncbi:hypothetical protein AB0E00_24495 [Streptomyces sp. NPDC048110]|uniref:hypothetical protein n=1 Tax=Streptomyces sp. NPDC048110 TaxID=3155483 RepID=UPI0033CF046D
MSLHSYEHRGMSGKAATGEHFRYAFKYEVPQAFVRFPETSDEAGWVAAMDELMPGSDEQARLNATAQMRTVLPLMTQPNTVETSACLGMEDDAVSMGFLIVSVQHTGHDNRLLAAEGIFRAKEQHYFAQDSATEDVDHELGKGTRGAQDLLLATQLPCGPGITSVSMRSLTLPTGDSGTEPPIMAIGLLQLLVPAPHDYCVYVTLSVPTIYHLDAYSARLAHIARTMSFNIPREESIVPAATTT